MTALAEISVAKAMLPQTYNQARIALEKCTRLDECKAWADKAEALASYAKQANDETLMKLAVRIGLCTDDELLARAALLDEMAAGCRDHAKEIRIYVPQRSAMVAASGWRRGGRGMHFPSSPAHGRESKNNGRRLLAYRRSLMLPIGPPLGWARLWQERELRLPGPAGACIRTRWTASPAPGRGVSARRVVNWIGENTREQASYAG